MMKRSALALATWFFWTIEAASAEFSARPYDARAVHRTATEMLQLDDDLCHGRKHVADESGLGDLAQFLVESLMSVDPGFKIDPLALDALAAVSGQGFPGWAMTSLGNRAVPALIKSAATVDGCGHRKGAMDALEQMLERPDIERSLTVDSKAAIRNLAARMISDPSLKHQEIGSAGYLAIATRDSKLRPIATHLTRPDELRRRGLDPDADRYYVEWTVRVIGEALEKFPPK